METTPNSRTTAPNSRTTMAPFRGGPANGLIIELPGGFHGQLRGAYIGLEIDSGYHLYSLIAEGSGQLFAYRGRQSRPPSVHGSLA